MSAERDLAEAIHHEIISPESVEHMLNIWREMPLEHPEWDERKRIWFLLAAASHEATEAVLARRQSEAARTGPWDDEEAVREYRPNSAHRPGGVDGSRPGPQEEDGYPGSLLPRKRGTP